jgi:YD repeat-containing protein
MIDRRPRRISLVLCAFALALAAPRGDVAIDGAIDVRDVHILQRAVRGLTPLDSQQQSNADVAPTVVTGTPGDGQVDTGDLTVLRQAVGFGDPDGDDLGQANEEQLGLSLFVRDSDGDGVHDGQEDPDEDGLSNRNEEAYGTNPLSADSDGDGVLDGRDAPAPALAKTEVTDVEQATKYLYTGTDPIQAGVAGATIDPTRVAVVRGKAVDESSAPIVGVAITVAGHPEFGSTRTLSDGGFDLVVNGGERLTLVLEKPGYLELFRRVETPVLDYRTLPDARLQIVDSTSSMVTLGGEATYWRGSNVTDARGTRRPTLIFQAGTTATIGGVAMDPQELTIHATESTKNSDVFGIPSVPLDLGAGHEPAWIGDFTVEQATGAEKVDFTTPVVLYFENYLGYPVGDVIGNGTLDPTRIAWIETGNPTGVVIQIKNIDSSGSDPIAEVDTDGNGTIDNTGLTDDERGILAELYADEQMLFRVPMNHFSKICTHKGVNWPLDTRDPDPPSPKPQTPDDCTPECGSIIDAESQVLKERVGVAGTPWSLHYTSERTPGYLAAYRVRIPLTGPTIPNSLAKVRLQVEIAGKRWSYPTFDRALPVDHPQRLVPNLSQPVAWEGDDAYERRPQGRQPVLARIEWGYPFKQTLNPDGTPGPTGLTFGGGLRVREWKGFLGPWDNRAQGIGGWTLTPVHAYDARTQVLYRGDGERVTAESLPEIIKQLNASPLPGGGPHGVAVAPDGRVYVALSAGGLVGRIELNRTYTPIVGHFGGSLVGDGGPAKNANLVAPSDLAFGPDGSLFISDPNANRIRRVQAPISPDSIISTVAGTGVDGYNPLHEGSAAVDATLDTPEGIAVAPDGTLYIGDGGNTRRVRRVTPDGIIETVAGKGTVAPGAPGYPAENNCQGTGTNPELPERALEAQIGGVFDLALGRDGSLFITSGCSRVYRVTSDGWLDSIAGGGSVLGDGGPATQAFLFPTHDILVAPDGSVYLGAVSTTAGSHRIRRIGTDGIISTVVGDGVQGSTGVGGPAAAARLNFPWGVALDPNGRLYIADLSNRVLRVEPPLPGFSIGTIAVPSRDGREVFEFDQTGHHLRTFDALRLGTTAQQIGDATRLTFAWAETGLLSITDADENVGHFGDRTTLDVDAAGWLTRAVDPAGGDHDFLYDPGTTSDGTGLLVTYTTPEEHTYEFDYDTEGLLIRDDDPAGGFKTLARTDAPPQGTPGWDVEVETALGRASTYSVAQMNTGTQTRTTTDPAGLVTTITRTPDYVETTAEPAGVTTISKPSSDPFQNLGFTAAFEGKLDVTTPGGRHLLRDRVRTLPAAGDYTDTIRYLNPVTQAVLKSSTVAWDHDATEAWLPGFAGRRRTTSFAARVFDEMLDPRGRLAGSKLGSLHPLKIGYDSNGRVASLAQGPGTGDRTTSFAYNAATGRLTSITDPASRVTTFDQYDAAGRALQMTLPGNRIVAFAYDANGNLTSLTPPGQPAHVFRYSAIDQEEEYEPPALAGIPDPRTIYTYDLDRALDFVARPDGKSVDLAYESSTGRLDTVTIAEGTYEYSVSDQRTPSRIGCGWARVVQAGAIEVSREQGLEVGERLGAREFSEDEAQVSVGFEAVGLGGLDHAVEVGAGVGAAGGVGEEPVLAPDDEGADGVLDEVGVEWDAAVVEDADELRPLVVEVGERLAGERLGRHARQGVVEPAAQRGEHGPRALLADVVPLLGRRVLRRALDGIELLDPPESLERHALLARVRLAAGAAQALQRLVELTPRMRPAADVHDAGPLSHGRVALVAVGLQHAFEALEEPLGHASAARGVVVEEHDGRVVRETALRP